MACVCQKNVSNCCSQKKLIEFFEWTIIWFCEDQGSHMFRQCGVKSTVELLLSFSGSVLPIYFLDDKCSRIFELKSIYMNVSKGFFEVGADCFKLGCLSYITYWQISQIVEHDQLI